MLPPTGSIDPSSGSFSVVNDWTDPINIGAACALMIPGSTTFNSLDFYVSTDQVAPSDTIVLTPIDKVICWFEVDAVTSTMIGDITSPTFTVDFTGSNPKSQTISYNAAGHWQNGPLSMKSGPPGSGTTTTTTTTTTNSAGPSGQTVTTVTTITTVTAAA
jgi:hypothetical protein